MKIWRIVLAAPIALLASQALAETWVAVASDSDGIDTSIDKDGIRRGDDGLVYFSDYTDVDGKMDLATDCQGRVLYLLKDEEHDYSDWRAHGQAVQSGSIGEKEYQYVCTNAG